MELDVVVVFTVTDGKVGEGDVGGIDGSLELAHADSQTRQCVEVRHDEDLPFRSSADIHHRYLRELFDTLGYDILGELAHPEEIRSVLERHIDIEGRNVGGAGFEDFGAVDTRQSSHCPVDLLIDLDVKIINVTAFLEGECHCRASVHSFGADVLEVSDLHEALAQRLHDGVVHLAGGHIRGCHLDSHVRDVHVGDERDGQPPDADDAEDDEHQQHHRYGDESLQ